jgi:hypothetical protein
MSLRPASPPHPLEPTCLNGNSSIGNENSSIGMEGHNCGYRLGRLVATHLPAAGSA